MTQKVKFKIVGDSKYQMIQRRTIEDTSAPAVKGGLLWADVECPCCSNEWRSHRGNGLGEFLPVLGRDVPTQCPECETPGVIPS